MDQKTATERRSAMKFIHVSDLHFHRDRRDNEDADTLLETILKKYSEHVLIITGDIADDGHKLQFSNAFEALNPFKGRVFIAPGNHDFGAAGNFYSRERALLFDEMLSRPLEQGGTFTGDSTPVVNIIGDGENPIMLIALDTNLETDHPFDFACGEVGTGQLSVLNRLLSNPLSADQIKILFFHHHPFMHCNPFMELKDASDLMRVIYQKVDVLLFGHKHVSGKWENCNGIQYVLASDNSPGKDWAREITVEKKKITVQDVPIRSGVSDRRRRRRA
jgi:3',5'-cyclic AMP phosphodiesterase CpdA